MQVVVISPHCRKSDSYTGSLSIVIADRCVCVCVCVCVVCVCVGNYQVVVVQLGV
jgi:hypothetical protein